MNYVLPAGTAVGGMVIGMRGQQQKLNMLQQNLNISRNEASAAAKNVTNLKVQGAKNRQTIESLTLNQKLKANELKQAQSRASRAEFRKATSGYILPGIAAAGALGYVYKKKRTNPGLTWQGAASGSISNLGTAAGKAGAFALGGGAVFAGSAAKAVAGPVARAAASGLYDSGKYMLQAGPGTVIRIGRSYFTKVTRMLGM